MKHSKDDTSMTSNLVSRSLVHHQPAGGDLRKKRRVIKNNVDGNDNNFLVGRSSLKTGRESRHSKRRDRIPREIISEGKQKPTLKPEEKNRAFGDRKLPLASDNVLRGLQEESINFPVNDECTSLTITPSGHFVAAGFSDGTLRFFDLTGKFWNPKRQKRKKSNDSITEGIVADGKESDDSETELEMDDDDDEFFSSNNASNDGLDDEESVETLRKSSSRLVPSSSYQRYGAVACQIHARGVHTDLLMHVECSQDGLYCFAGVTRGSTELHAVFLGDLERAAIDDDVNATLEQESNSISDKDDGSSSFRNNRKNLLDFVKLEMHSDAKLKGFGACTRVLSKREAKGSVDVSNLGRPKYVLLTGKGIKNIHCWCFEPSVCDPKTGEEILPASWQQLYDTQTNGTTISMLALTYTPSGKMLAISKSDDQKLRLWDLGREQPSDKVRNSKVRPKRPPYQDVKNSTSALSVSGAYCICGGKTMFNEMSLVRLDQPESEYNHTDLALPCNDSDHVVSRRNRRKQRGDLKQVRSVASMVHDASHILLELDDGSLVHCSIATKDSRLPRLELVGDKIPPLPDDHYTRQIGISTLFSRTVVAVVSMYNPTSGQGSIAVRALEWNSGEASALSKGPKFSHLSIANVTDTAISSPPRSLTAIIIDEAKSNKPKDSKMKTSSLKVPLIPDRISPLSVSPISSDGIQLKEQQNVVGPPSPRRTLDMSPDSKPAQRKNLISSPVFATRIKKTKQSTTMAKVSPEPKVSLEVKTSAPSNSETAITKYFSPTEKDSLSRPAKKRKSLQMEPSVDRSPSIVTSLATGTPKSASVTLAPAKRVEMGSDSRSADVIATSPTNPSELLKPLAMKPKLAFESKQTAEAAKVATEFPLRCTEYLNCDHVTKKIDQNDSTVMVTFTPPIKFTDLSHKLPLVNNLKTKYPDQVIQATSQNKSNVATPTKSSGLSSQGAYVSCALQENASRMLKSEVASAHMTSSTIKAKPKIVLFVPSEDRKRPSTVEATKLSECRDTLASRQPCLQRTPSVNDAAEALCFLKVVPESSTPQPNAEVAFYKMIHANHRLVVQLQKALPQRQFTFPNRRNNRDPLEPLSRNQNASYMMLQRRVLRDTGEIIKNLAERAISIEDAKGQLRETIEHFRGVLSHTHRRHVLELSAVLAQEAASKGKPVNELHVHETRLTFRQTVVTLKQVQHMLDTMRAATPRRSVGRRQI